MTATRRLLLLLVLAGIPLGFWPWVPSAGWIGGAGIGLVLLVAIGDVVVSPGSKAVTVERRYAPRFDLGEYNDVELIAHNRSNLPLSVTLVDEPPKAFESEEPVFRVSVGPRQDVRAGYACRPGRRGRYEFGRIGVGVSGVLGLVQANGWKDVPGSVRVYPDTSGLRRAELMRVKASPRLAGQLPVQAARESGEFESLRDYVPDDDYRWIDWKATARARKPISRNFRPERNQLVYLLLDCGRPMVTHIGGFTRLDYSLKAALTLGYVALRQQDRVGLIAFSSRIEVSVPPSHSREQFGRLLETTCHLEATLTESNYENAFLLLRRRCSRRALIVVFTDVLNAERTEALRRCTAALLPRHLPLIVTIQDLDLRDQADRPAETTDEVYRKGVANEVVLEREVVLRELEGRGAMVVDTTSSALLTRVVETYLEIKRRHRL